MKLWLVQVPLMLCLYLISSMVASNELTNIKVQLKWRHQFQFAGYYAAIDQGYYQSQGLDVTLLERLPGPSPIDTLIVGKADYAVGAVGALIYRDNGVPLVVLAAIFQNSPSILVSRYPELSDLKDKKVMLSKGVMNAEITAMIENAGLTDEDIEVIPSNQSLVSFIENQIDAYNAYSTNEIFKLEQQGVTYFSFDPKDYGINFYGDVLVTTEQKVQSNRAQVDAFKQATLKGWQYAIEHPEQIIELILAKYNTQNKSHLELEFEAKELIKLIHADIVPIGYMNKQRWQDIAEILLTKANSPKSDIDYQRFLYTQPQNKSVLDLLKQYYKELTVFFIILVSIFLVFHNIRLSARIRSRTVELEVARIKAEQDARTDPLTGLSNRRYFMEAIEHDLSIAKRNNLELSIIYIDIDWFKSINDTLGHDAGDEALKAITTIIKRNIRSSDTAARTGGEEFVILCLEQNKADAIHLAERIRSEVDNHLFSYQQQNFKLTVSLGVASVTSDETISTVLKKSDDALYQAKKSGRNQVKWI